MKWMLKRKGKETIRSSYLLFSLIYLSIAILVIIYLISNHLTFVRNGDAYTQHYPAFLYMGEWYRSALGGLLTGKGLPSIWDFSIGYGLDAGQTLFFYGFFDWVSIVFSFFANSNNGYWFYTIMMLFQAYLAGIAFVLFCQKHNCSKSGSVIAALAYITCPYMLENVFNGHPNFANPLMYLPLILIGIEDIIRGKNSVRYIITVSLSILSSLYYFYMEMVFAVVYFFCRSVYINSENKLWSVLRSGLIISGHTITGILISMPIILPIISGIVSDKRTTTHIPIPALYTIEEYRESIKSLITSNSFIYYGHLGVSACILIGVILLFTCKNKNSGWIRILWIISLVSCLIHYLGYLMNGRTYIANRHVWIYIMMTCFSFAFQFDNMFDLQKKSACLTILIISLFIISLCLTDNNMDGETQSEAILLVTGLVICILYVFFRDRRGCKLAAIVLMSVLVIAGVIIHIKGVFLDRKGADSFFSPQKVRKIEQQYLAKYDLIDDATPWRMDWDENGRKMNMLNNTVNKGSTYTYWSFLNSNLTSYLDMNGVINFTFETDALKDRYYLQSLNAVKYISANRQIDLEGYEKYNQNGEIVINNNSMSLARWYDAFLSETDYKALSYAERERAQAFCCIANEEIINKSSMESNCTSVKTQNTVDYSVESEGNGVSSNSIIINNPEEPLVYTFDCPAKGVLYFEIVGLVDCSYNVVIRAECNGVSQKAIHVAPTYRYYWGKNSYLFNMGYDEQSRKSLTLWFGQKGEYIFDNIKVEFTPYEEFADTMKTVKEECDIDNITITDDAIVANVITDKTRIIYYSIPFSPGWKMYVDDEETPLFRANIMGIGAEIDAGEHRIILRYTPPYFGIGVLLAFVGLIGAITVLKYPSLLARKRRTKL